jgi:hypothetical protein
MMLMSRRSEFMQFRVIDYRRRLRAILLRQWKRRRTIVKRLIAMGVSAKAAWGGIYRERRSWWALSASYAVHQGLSNASFAARGLPLVTEQWKLWRLRHVNVPKQMMLWG